MLSQNVKEEIKNLYGVEQFDMQTARYDGLKKEFEAKYGEAGIFVSAPGRIEICGNHTDHQHGKVLGAAIDLDTLGMVKKSDNGRVRIESMGYPVFEFDVERIEKSESELGSSTALTKGVLAYLKDKGYKIGGFTALMTSRVFKGAGVSSSASFEILIGKIVSVLFNEDKIEPIELIKAGHFAETVYFGKPCGMLDQSMIALGGVNYMDFLSPQSPVIENMKPDFKDYSIVLVNSGGDHSNLTGCYADIKSEMNSVAEFFGVEVLREVKEEDFYRSFAKLSQKVNGRAMLRATHFFEENERVESAKTSLKEGKFEEFFHCLNQSGESSYKLLQNCYAESDKAQRIPLALLVASKAEDVVAKRVHGGGFAGTVLVIVDKKKSQKFVEKAVEVFGEDNVYCLNIRNYGAVAF